MQYPTVYENYRPERIMDDRSGLNLEWSLFSDSIAHIKKNLTINNPEEDNEFIPIHPFALKTSSKRPCNKFKICARNTVMQVELIFWNVINT